MKRSDKKKARRSADATPHELRLPKALFTTGFDQIAIDWHKNQNAPDSNLPSIRIRMALEGLRVSEALLLSPKVSFRVYGENDVLCRLLDMFDVAGVEQLLEEGAIEFVLWRGNVVHWNSEPRPEGVLPLAPLTLTTPAHCDPSVSNELGLKRWERKAWPELERLSKLATERTRILEERLPNVAIEAVYAAYKSGALIAHGFDPSRPLESLSIADAGRLSTLAHGILEGMLMLDSDYDLHESVDSWKALVAVYSRIAKDDRLVQTVEDVLRLEGLPSLKGMIKSGAIGFGDIVAMRANPATEEFRKWLWSQPDPRDAKAVSEAYLRQITNKKMVDKDWFKVAKIIGMNVVQTGVGAGIGAGLAGVPGMIAGGALGAIMNAGETFGLDKLLRGASPRRFAEEVVRPRFAQQVAASPQTNRAQRRAEAAKERKKLPR